MPPKELHDYISRRKSASPFGRATFIGLRALDGWWQYEFLTRGWASQAIAKLGGQSVHGSQILNSANIAGLQPYYGLVNLLALGGSLKEIVTMMFISEQETPISFAITISALNTLFNSVNTLLSVWAVTSQRPSSSSSSDFPAFFLDNPLVALGFGAYAIGLLIEAVSEFQRTAFKKDPANKGKPYGGGLFSLATNINYGGHTIWRAGYALVTGGLAPAVVTFSFFFHDFATRGVPVLDEYLTSRYGDEYRAIKSLVRYRLIPGIY